MPPAPYYSNLVTETVAPIKEYDNVIYTCYNSSLKLPNKAQNFKVGWKYINYINSAANDPSVFTITEKTFSTPG